MPTARPLLFALSLCTAFPRPAGAAEPSTVPPAQDTHSADTPEDGGLTLALAVPGGDDELATHLRPAVLRLLSDRGHEVSTHATNGVFVIINLDPDARDTYQVELRLELGEKTRFYAASSCQRCGSAALVAHIGGRLDNVLPDLEASIDDGRAKQAARRETKTTKKVVVPVTPQTTTERTSRRALTPRGTVGTVLLGGGIASVATGAVLWAKRTSNHPSRPDWELRLRPPGITMVALGTASAVAGAVLVGLEFTQRRESHVSASPLIGRGLSGLSLRGRF